MHMTSMPTSRAWSKTSKSRSAGRLKRASRSRVYCGPRSSPSLPGAPAVEGRHVAQLELHGVGAGAGGELDELLGQLDRAVVVDADLGDDERRVAGPDVVPPDPEGVAAVDRDGDEVAAVVDERDVVDGVGEEEADLGRGRRGRGADGVGVRDVGARPGEVDLGLGGDPAADVAVGDRPDEVAVLADAEDDARAVGGDLLQGPQDGVLAVDDEGRDRALDDHAVAPGVRASSCCSATARSSSVSASTPSTSSMTKSPTRPPIRLSSSSYTHVRVRYSDPVSR